MTKDEALRVAMDWYGSGNQDPDEFERLILSIVAQPEQEPVAWISTSELLVMRGNALGGAKDWRINLGLVKQDGDVGLYTIPPQRTWVGLTEKDICEAAVKSQEGISPRNDTLRFAIAIEAKLKEKNG